MKHCFFISVFSFLLIAGCKKEESNLPETTKQERCGNFLVTTQVHYWDYVSGDSYNTIPNDTLRVVACSDSAVKLSGFFNTRLSYNYNRSNSIQTVYSYYNDLVVIFYNSYPDSISGTIEFASWHRSESRTFAGHRIK